MLLKLDSSHYITAVIYAIRCGIEISKKRGVVKMAATNSSTGTEGKSRVKTVRPAASKKPGIAKGGNSSRTRNAKGTSSSNKKAGKEKIYQSKIEDVNEYKDKMAFETAITLIVMLILALFLYLSYFGLGGIVGKIFGGLFFGLFGWSAWIFPAGIIVGYVFALVNQGDRRVLRKLISFIAAIWLLLGITDLLFKQEIMSEYYTSNHVMHPKYFECVNLTLGDVLSKGKANAGMVGRLISSIFSKVIGETGAVVIMLALLILSLFVFNGMELMAALRKRNAYKQEMENTYAEIKSGGDYREPSYRVAAPSAAKRQHIQGASVMQSVNLKEMNQTLDGIEETERKNAINRSRMEEITLDNVSPLKGTKDIDNRNSKGTDGNKRKKSDVQSINEIQDNWTDELKTGYTSRGQAVNKKDGALQHKDNIPRQETDEERRRRNLESIPVFRDELNKKFGKTPDGAQGMKPLFPIKDIPVQDLAKEKKTDIPSMERIVPGTVEETTNNITTDNGYSCGHIENVEETASQSSINETGSSNIINIEESIENTGDSSIINIKESPASTESYITENPASTGSPGIIESYNEENITDAEYTESQYITDNITDTCDTDVVQNVYTAGNNTEDIAERTEDIVESGVYPSIETDGNVGKPASLAKPVPAGATDHKRIGGDNYVSASSTFNALNNSKEESEEIVQKKEYIFPPVDLLALPKETSHGMTDDELRNTALKLQDTLKSFNVNVNMGAVTCGPTVTRYELFPEQGVRVNKITNLADDLKLNLAASSIRIEAPIPGKSAVGIEIPNPEPGSVAFRELLEGEAFQKAKSPVTFAVGKDIGGNTIMTDIAKMPHLLIAGATGSGKSVCINTLIMSVLYKANPDDVKLIMIDPKVVELSVYNGIPHLFCPVVTDPKEASAALNWAVREMMDRYNKFTELCVRNISGYNEKIKTVPDAEKAGYAKMPLLIIIVDEFADLMMVASKEVEDSVCRIAQLARAAGIHLVLATQRPSVNVITGIIKANIPSRIAFSVSSAIDSRTILDKGGAEKLIGKGDMLFFPSGYSEPVRVQGAFVSDKEVSDVVEFLRNNNEEPEYNENVTEMVESQEASSAPEQKESKPDRDEYFEEAGRFVIESERAAAGQLQRRFSIGFNRAGRIIDQLHKAGVVGPAEGTKPRKILMTMNDFDLLLGNVPPVTESEIEETMQNYAEAGSIEGAPDGQY